MFHTDFGIPALGLAALAVGAALAQQRVVMEQITVRWHHLFRLFHQLSPEVNGFGARIGPLNTGKVHCFLGLTQGSLNIEQIARYALTGSECLQTASPQPCF
jgi:hypothetical protein